MQKTTPLIWIIVCGFALCSALNCSGRWVTSYHTEACQLQDGRLRMLVKQQSSQSRWDLLEGFRWTGRRRFHWYWLDVEYEAVWAKAKPEICIQPLFRSETDGSGPSVIAAKPALLAWGSQWEKLKYFDVGRKLWTTVQDAPPGKFVYTGISGGDSGDLTWVKGDHLYTYDFGAAGFRPVGSVPQCKAELGDEVWHHDSHKQRRAVVLGARTVVWAASRGETVSHLYWYDTPTGVFLGKLSVPAGLELLAQAWNGNSPVFAFRDASGVATVWTEAGPMPHKQALGADIGFDPTIRLSLAPPALLVIRDRASEVLRARQWEIREWRYLEGLCRTGTLSVAIGDLDQRDGKFSESCTSEPYGDGSAMADWILQNQQ